MNDKEPKKINFNKSILFSLKAELLKKKDEVNQKKILPQHNLVNHKPVVSKNFDKNENDIPKKSFKDCLQINDSEEVEACRKSKLALEKKTELYKHLSDVAGKSQLAGQYLVDFDTKKKLQPERPSSPFDDNYDDEEDSEWTEFTDCLGRTRKCLKIDLEVFKERDKELRGVKEDVEQNVDNNKVHVEKPLLVQKTQDYLLSLREKWEQKERELLSQDRDIHYQDILYDEARIHGVGYYSFSTNETERRRQMEELVKLRMETLQAQKEAEENRRKRDELVAARVAAAKARKRLRAGLPPEDPDDAKKEFEACLQSLLNQQRNEAEAEIKEKENKLKEEQEIERQKFRESYVRDWDVGKKGVKERVKKFKEMTQEEYVEQQRDKRIDEFAPPQASSSKYIDTEFDNKGRVSSMDIKKSNKNISWSDVRPEVDSQAPHDLSEIDESKGLYFSTSSKTQICETPPPLAPLIRELNNPVKFKVMKTGVKYRNFNKEDAPIPIVNEISDDDAEMAAKPSKSNKRVLDNYAEIEPPLTYEYFGPVPKNIKTNKPFDTDIMESFDKGVKSLQSKPSNRQLSKQYDFTLLD